MNDVPCALKRALADGRGRGRSGCGCHHHFLSRPPPVIHPKSDLSIPASDGAAFTTFAALEAFFFLLAVFFLVWTPPFTLVAFFATAFFLAVGVLPALTFFFVSTGCDFGDFGFGVRADRRGVGALVFAGVFFAGALAGVFLFEGVFFGVLLGVFFGVFFGVASAFAAVPLGFLGFVTCRCSTGAGPESVSEGCSA